MARIYAVGDANVRPEAFEIANLIQNDKATYRFLYLGDVYDNGTPRDYAERYDPIFGKLKYLTKPIPGNHDWHSKLEGYRKYWPDKPPYYSKEYGGWKLLFIDSMLQVAPGSPQYNWAKGHAKRWLDPVIVVHHHHLYCSGGHGDQPYMQPIMDLFKDRVCVGLSGHTHNMQLFKPVGNYTQVVVGCGGQLQYDINTNDPRLMWHANEFGVARLDLSPGRLDLAFVKHTGDVLHEATIRDTRRFMMI